MRKLGKHAFLSLAAALLLLPGVTQAVITLCNSSAGEMGLIYVLEDPNLRLFTKYPYTSRGLFTLRPAECTEISMGRSEGMRVHFQTFYKAEDNSWQPGKYDVRNTREVHKSGRRFCTHNERGWDLSRAAAVKCPPGYIHSDFGYKLVVPSTTSDYRLSLTANRPPPTAEKPVAAKKHDSKWHAVPFPEGGLQISVMTQAGFTMSCSQEERKQQTAFRVELSGLSKGLSVSSSTNEPEMHLADLRVSLSFFKAGAQQLNASLRQDGIISTKVDVQAAKDLKEKLLKSNGIFEVAIAGVDDVLGTLNDSDRKKIKSLAGKSAIINAPGGEAGPLTNLMGLFHETCLAEGRLTAPLDVSGWTLNAGLNIPGFMVTPTLTFHARTLSLQCVIVGEDKSGFVKLHPYPYTYMGRAIKSIDMKFTSGRAYRLGAKLSDSGDTVESQLAFGDLTKLVKAMRDEQGEMEITIDNEQSDRLRIPLAIPDNLFGKFLGQCR